jgi:ribosomal protein L5
MGENVMRGVEIEKMTLNIGGITDKLEKGVKLLQLLTDRKPAKIKSKKRIPSWGVRPKLEVGCKVTIRDKEKIQELLKRLFSGIENEISNKQIQPNHLSIGIREYIEIPGMEYIREVGIMGLEADVVFSRKGGKRNTERKIKRGKMPKKQVITSEEIINYMKKNFNIKIREER